MADHTEYAAVRTEAEMDCARWGTIGEILGVARKSSAPLRAPVGSVA